MENTRASNPLLGYYQDITASTAADVGGKGPSYCRRDLLLFLFVVVVLKNNLHIFINLYRTRMLVQSGCRGNDTTNEGDEIGQGRVICGWTL